jgi:monofunctional biosynthetic peptidoglycan transglycosylase
MKLISNSITLHYLFTGLARIVKAFIIAFFIASIYFTACFSFIPPRRTPLMLKRQFQQTVEKKKYEFRHEWVPVEQISSNLVQAVVATEDNRFMKHYGIDFGAIKKARDYNLKSTKRKRGASTISQQTAKNVFLWPARTYLRKGFEVYFTLLIETVWSKKRIMEVYLNMIEMGPGIYGAEAASRYYFKKPASALTPGEAALIAVSLPNPRKRNPAKPSNYMVQRQHEVLSLMRKIGSVKF